MASTATSPSANFIALSLFIASAQAAIQNPQTRPSGAYRLTLSELPEKARKSLLGWEFKETEVAGGVNRNLFKE